MTFPTETLTYLAERSAVFAVVFLVTGAAWLVLRHKLGAHVGSLWFLVPLVVLVAPVERWIPNPWTQANPIESAARRVLPARFDSALGSPTRTGFLDFSQWTAPNIVEAPRSGATPLAIDAPSATSPPTSRPTWPATTTWLFAAWVLLLVGFTWRLVRAQRSVPKLLKSATRIRESGLPIDLADLCRRAGIRKAVWILESSEFDSPAVWSGGPRAAVILPEGLVARLAPDELRWVLLHELAHLSRRDHLVELVQRTLGVAFFFHPLVWVSNRMVRAYRELACDEAALALSDPGDRPRSARALLEVVAHATALAGRPGLRTRTPHAMPSLFHSKKLLRKRIMRLAEPRRTPSRGLRASALLPLLLTSTVALAAARFPAASVQDDGFAKSELIEDHEEIQENTIKDARDAALLATDWLMSAQDKDGGWSFQPPAKASTPARSGWGANLPKSVAGTTRNPSFDPIHTDVALTGLALQALVRRAALDPTHVNLRVAVEKAANHLLAIQDPDTGFYGPQDHSAFIVGHALATEALARASTGSLSEARKSSLTRAVAAIESARNPYGAWRYESPPIGESDARVTGYMLLALSAAYDVGVHASPEAFANGMQYLLELEDPETGRTHYMHGREFALRLIGRHESFPAEYCEVSTAMHMRLRNLAGLAPFKEENMTRAVAVLGGALPVWDDKGDRVDFNYWWQGTEALASMSPRSETWVEWSLALRRALIGKQITNGPLRGTWPTEDAWSTPGLEAYTAATGALSLFTVVAAESSTSK